MRRRRLGKEEISPLAVVADERSTLLRNRGQLADLQELLVRIVIITERTAPQPAQANG